MNKRSTRDRLLDAGIALMWRQGFNAVSVDAICAQAHANKGSFYHAFASKDKLLVAAIDRVWAHDEAALNAIMTLDASAAERLERHLDWFMESQQRHLAEHGFVAGHFHAVIDANIPEAAQAATANRAAYRAMMRTMLANVLTERGASTDYVDGLTDMITYFVSGVIGEARLSNSLAPIELIRPLAFYLLDQTIAAGQFQSMYRTRS